MNEKISNIDKQIKYLEQQKKCLVKGLENEYRKERTRRLIQTGALCEKYFNLENLNLKEREDFFKYTSSFFKNQKD